MGGRRGWNRSPNRLPTPSVLVVLITTVKDLVIVECLNPVELVELINPVDMRTQIELSGSGCFPESG